MKTHTVKSWAHFYDAILRGLKTHDLRKAVLPADYCILSLKVITA
jgi:hypothetical protein